MKGLLDSYSRRARLEPALIVALPAGLATLAWFPSGLLGWGLMWSLIVYCGGAALLSQVARDRGKNKEDLLYDSWGGKPTTRFLRHRDSANKVLLEQRHKRLQEMLPAVKIPTQKDEKSDPTNADQVYETCTVFLIERTRNRERFPLIFEENCNYGFRRNLWGMKPLGIAISAAGTCAVVALLILDWTKGIIPNPIVIMSGLIEIVLLLGWLFWFTPEWVRIAAKAYAERLLAACDTL
jgi:hypothetical protein